MRVLHAGRQTIHANQLFPDLPGYVSEIGKGRDYADLLRKNQARL
jgi:hypothetical protein